MSSLNKQGSINKKRQTQHKNRGKRHNVATVLAQRDDFFRDNVLLLNCQPVSVVNTHQDVVDKLEVVNSQLFLIIQPPWRQVARRQYVALATYLQENFRNKRELVPIWYELIDGQRLNQ